MEEIWELIWKGFNIWRRNLNLCIPFLYSMVALVLVAVSLNMLFYVADIPLAFHNGSISGYSQQDISLGWILLLAAIIISLSIRLFFDIGAIGMARQALESGRSDMSSMWSTAKRHFWNMFLLCLLNGLIVGLATLAVLILIFDIEQIASATPEIPDSSYESGILILRFYVMFALIQAFVLFFTHLQAALIFLVPASVFALILSVILSPAPYALVLKGWGPVQAIRAGLDFFRGNKFDVLVLYLVTTALSLLILLIIWQIMSFQIEDALSNILQSLSNTILYYIILLAAILADLLILAPLTNLWWTRLYMVRNGMLNSEEMKDPQ